MNWIGHYFSTFICICRRHACGLCGVIRTEMKCLCLS